MTASPNALCFGEGYPASGAPCHVDVTADGLAITFTGTAAQETHRVSFDLLSIAAGGFDHDQLVVRWQASDAPSTLYLKDSGAIQAFRKRAPAGLSGALHHTAVEVRRRRRQRRVVVWAASMVVVTVAAALWAGAGLITEWVVALIPVSWEESLGESAYRQLIMGQTVLSDGPAVEAVERLTGRLSAAIPGSPYAFRVAVVDSGAINAFALPGGHLVVFTGLLKEAASSEEVAGVLGHEFAHVLQRHAMERLVKSLGFAAVVTILTGNEQGFAGLVKELGLELATLKFGRDQEIEADVEGLRLLLRAKVSPEGMVRFFQRLAEHDARRMEILSSHPMSGERANRLRDEIAGHLPVVPEPLTIDWAQVRDALQ